MSDCRELEHPSAEPPPVDPSRQLSLRWLLVAMAIVGAMLGGALRLNAPALFINVILASIAVVAWMVARPSLAGMILGTLGLQTAVVAGVVYYLGDDLTYRATVVRTLAILAFVLLMLAWHFFSRCCDTSYPSHRENRIAIFAFIALALSAAFFVPLVSAVSALYQKSLDEAQGRENAAQLQTLIDQVDALCARLEDVPQTEDELIRLLGHPLREISGNRRQFRIYYRKAGPGHFFLEIPCDGDILFYDSSKRSTGWNWTPY